MSQRSYSPGVVRITGMAFKGRGAGPRRVAGLTTKSNGPLRPNNTWARTDDDALLQNSEESIADFGQAEILDGKGGRSTDNALR